MNSEGMDRLIGFFNTSPLLAIIFLIVFILMVLGALWLVAYAMEANEAIERENIEYIRDLNRRIKDIEDNLKE